MKKFTEKKKLKRVSIVILAAVLIVALGGNGICKNREDGGAETVQMNSVDNALGVAVANSLVYPEVIDMEEAVAYYYSHFYHIKNDRIDTVTAAEFANVAEFDKDEITDTNVSTLISNYANNLAVGYDFHNEVQDDIVQEYPSLILFSHIFEEE